MSGAVGSERAAVSAPAAPTPTVDRGGAPTPERPAGPSITIGGSTYPVVLPRLSDPRMHLAAVVITLQVLGQTTFGFDLSIAQILLTVGICGAIETVLILRRDRAIVWPASALLTANGAALILRVPGTEHGDWWSLEGWYVFALVGALAVLSKWAIRWRGRPVFNPSNAALVVGFLVLGANLADPQDLWWGPLSPGLVLAVAVILVGSVVITHRLRLFGIALGFWLTLAAGIALLVPGGHCMEARWSLEPVCGTSFWWVVLTSPEVLVFTFFMVTDPKTTPTSPRNRVIFGVAVGALAAFLVSLTSSEFGTKVAILAALVLGCAARPVLSWLRAPAAPAAIRRAFRRTGPRPAPVAGAWSVGFAALGVVAILGGSTVGGSPELTSFAPSAGGAPPEVEIDASQLDHVTVSAEVRAVDPSFDDDAARDVARDVLVALEVERRVVDGGDPDLAATVFAGERLEQVGDPSAPAPAARDLTFEEMEIVLVRVGDNPQAAPRLAVEATGETSSGDAAHVTFVMEQTSTHFVVIEERRDP